MGFIGIFVAFLMVLLAGFVVTKVPLPVAITVLAVPAAIVIVLSVIQWWQARSCGADRPSWAHMVGIFVALFSWIAWPTVPSQFIIAGSVSGACASFYNASAECLQRVAGAWDHHDLAWWLTGAMLLVLALLARRSRIAAWGAIPVSIAGCELAQLYLQSVLLHYHIIG